MDTQTGRIHSVEELAKNNADQFEVKEPEKLLERLNQNQPGRYVQVDNQPDPNCKKCKGKGHKGLQFRNGVWRYIPCGCLFKTTEKAS